MKIFRKCQKTPFNIFTHKMSGRHMITHIYIGILFRPFRRDLTLVLGVHLNYTKRREGLHFSEHVFFKLCCNTDSDHTRYHASRIQNDALDDPVVSSKWVTESCTLLPKGVPPS